MVLHRNTMQGENIKEQIDPDHVFAMLAAELNQMTVQEREKVCEELHGVDEVTPETEEMLTTSLKAMDIALQRVPNRAIYDKAKLINASYVEDRSFRLMFLRSEYYNPEPAAVRLVNFLENKVRYFGNETLARPIYLSDLNDDDMAVLRSGILQQIPARDSTGRAILSDFNMDPTSTEQPKDINNYMKTLIYMILAAAEDEETQKRGMIGILYFTNALNLMQRIYHDEHRTRARRLFEWIPIKLVGVHFCFCSDARFRVVQALMLSIMGRECRVRVRMHEGSHIECQYKLMTFGIPVSYLPVGTGGDGPLRTTAHLKWLSRRMVKERACQQSSSSSTALVGTFEGIDLPGTRDVLLGRGKTIQDHRGNIILRSLIAEHLQEYRSAPKNEKGNVAWKVLMATKMQGGRFLKRETSGWWVEVSDETAKEKINMTYRTSRSWPKRRHVSRPVVTTIEDQQQILSESDTTTSSSSSQLLWLLKNKGHPSSKRPKKEHVGDNDDE